MRYLFLWFVLFCNFILGYYIGHGSAIHKVLKQGICPPTESGQ